MIASFVLLGTIGLINKDAKSSHCSSPLGLPIDVVIPIDFRV